MSHVCSAPAYKVKKLACTATPFLNDEKEIPHELKLKAYTLLDALQETPLPCSKNVVILEMDLDYVRHPHVHACTETLPRQPAARIPTSLGGVCVVVARSDQRGCATDEYDKI